MMNRSLTGSSFLVGVAVLVSAVAVARPASQERGAIDAQPVDGRDRLLDVVRPVDKVVSIFRSEGIAPDTRNWLSIHALLMFGDTAFRDAGDSPPLRALFDRILKGGPDIAESAFVVRGGKPYPRHTGDRFSQEHHRDQFLAKLGLSGVPLAAPLVANGRKFTVRDLLDRSLLDVTFAGELSWSVSAYSHYLPPGHTWKNKLGEDLSLAPLAEALLTEKDLPCGGSHNLFAMARVLSRPELRQDTAIAKLVPRFEGRLEEECRRLRRGQRPDGSFTPPSPMREELEQSSPLTPYVNGVWYTGHTLEWIAVGLPAERLREEWILRAVGYLVRGLEVDFRPRINTGLRNDEERFAYGYMTHAHSGLHRWRSRVRAPGGDQLGESR
jgi:hypothetical protein